MVANHTKYTSQLSSKSTLELQHFWYFASPTPFAESNIVFLCQGGSFPLEASYDYVYKYCHGRLMIDTKSRMFCILKFI